MRSLPPSVRSRGGSALVANQIRRELEQHPKVYGSAEPAISRNLVDVLGAAEDEASQQKDDYVSAEQGVRPKPAKRRMSLPHSSGHLDCRLN